MVADFVKAYDLFAIGAESVAADILDHEISDLFADLRTEMGVDAVSPWDEMVGRFQRPGMGGRVPTCDVDKAWGY